MSFAITGTTLGLTYREWAEQTRRNHLDPHETYSIGRLENALDTALTVVETTYSLGAIRPQAIIEIDGEQMLVWDDVDSGTSNTDWTVERGYNGTIAAAHTAGALIHCNPRWSLVQLCELLHREIRSWTPNIFIPATATFSVNKSIEAFDLDGLEDFEVYRLLRVQRNHRRTSNNSWPTVDARLERRQDDDFPSGYALRIAGGPGYVTPQEADASSEFLVSVGYRPPTFAGGPDASTWTLDDDLGELLHINGALADAAMYGVAGQLLIAAEVERTRTTSQQRPRRAEDVPPGHSLQAGQALLSERDGLLKSESERLTSQWSGFTPR